MRIQYDTFAFDMQNYGGISNYFANIFDYISKEEEVKLPIMQTNNEYLLNRHFLNPDMFEAVINAQGLNYETFRNINMSNQLTNIVELAKFKPDILHTTFFYEPHYPQIISRYELLTKIVCTIHDMIPEIYNWSNGNDVQIINKRLLAYQSEAIICPSESTKNDIIKYIPDVDVNKIHVIYHGVNTTKCNYINKYNFPYILYVGGRMQYKRWNEFLNESKIFLDNHKECKIIATGSELTEEELTYIKELGLEDKVITKHVTTEELVSLYHYAICFVFSSEYEGFGMPILEAWQHKCITLLNDIPVFKEIADKSSLFFDINKEGSLSEKLEEVYNLSANKKQLRLTKQNKRLKDFSWEKSAEEHIKVYQSIL